jgi:periplasmic divalent cation tolerance protein
MTDLIQVTTTFDNQKEAEKIAKMLLKKKLAACIQLIGPVLSQYWWEGKVDKANEFMLFIKTTEANFENVRELIKKNHSYELPEIIATPIVAGNEEYLEWFRKNTK